MTSDEIEELLASELEGAMLIGVKNERKNYYPTIVGIDTNGVRVIYDRDKLIECFANSQNMTREDAEEWVSYNVDRALPYYGEHSPIIMNILL